LSNTATSQAPRRSAARLPPKALAALIAAFAAIGLISVLSEQSREQRAATVAAVRQSDDVRQRLYKFLAELIDAESGQRGYLLTGLEPYLVTYELARATVPDQLATLTRLLAGNPEQKRQLEELSPQVQAKLAELAETIAMKRSGDDTGALRVVRSERGKALMDRIRSGIEGLLDVESGVRAKQDEASVSAVRWSSYVTFGGIGVVACMILLIGWFASGDFRAVAAEDWLRRIELTLATQLQGDLRIESLGDKVLAVVAQQLDAQVGAIYAVEPGEQLRLVAGYALDASARGAVVKFGEGLAGEAARRGRFVHLRKLPADHLQIRSALGRSRPRELAILPATVDGVVEAVIELGFLHAVDAHELEALRRVGEAVAIAIRTARDRSKLEELLEETQIQSAELQTQQEELRISNEELEQQRKALQASQAQLENQQAELEQINTQLESQTQSLEAQRDELARASAELQRSSEYKSQFLANMSHELRTPLNSSLILSKLLADNRDGNLTPEQIKFAQTIYSAGNDLLTLINDILDLSKVEAGMLEVKAETVPLARVLDELGGAFHPMAAQKRLDLGLRLAPGAPQAIETDRTRLQQILKNLLSNALKFTERGSVTLEISAIDGHVAFAVHDTGIGIASDQHAVIFEAFRQADGASNRKFGGTGLGLSISRELARLLGGDVNLESAPGRGSTFTLVLPVSYAGGSATPVAVALPPHRPRTPTPLPIAHLDDDRDRVVPRSRTLLIIEDDPVFARVLYELAHELDFLAILAPTAGDGLELARRHRPSAIVLDIGLPDRSGLAVLDSLKRDATIRHIPVHVVSASDHTREALEMGAVGSAIKPVERTQLIDAIKHLEAKFTQELRRVLIVEDDPVLRDSTAQLLGSADVEVVTVSSAAEALDQLGRSTFDCMVLDLALPDRNGLELLEDMSHGEQYGFPPVIVYTGRSLSSHEVHELERFSRSIIIKGARSPERLLDEVTLFLHQVESGMPAERQRMLKHARDREAVFEGRRVLIAEDDVRNVFALSSVLEPRGAIVVIARNGREAVAAVQAQPDIDLVLMDIMMPEMDGLEATRQLRADPRFARLPIIAITAKAMIDDRDKCIEAGASDYIAKPLDVDKLLSLARVWIRK